MPSYAQVHLAVERIPPGPWIYARLTDDAGPGGPPAGDGDLVEVVDGEGRFCGHGLYNSTSDIRIRMLSRGRRTDMDRPREFLRRAIASAVRLRRKVLRLDAVCDAYRLVRDGELDVAVAGDGSVYVVDQRNNRIQVFRPR